MPGAASRKRATSSGLKTTGTLRGSCMNDRCLTRSGRSSVTLKKNRSAATVALIFGVPAPLGLFGSLRLDSQFLDERPAWNRRHQLPTAPSQLFRHFTEASEYPS